MKTALLLSGIARHVERGYDSIYHHLLKPNPNTDVFIHTWLDAAANPELEKKVFDLFAPVKCVMEKPKTFRHSSLNMERMMNSYAKPYKREYFVEAFYSAWYSVLQSNLLKEQYRLENDINYDYVIRARFDITYTAPIVCSNFDPNILHISDRGLPPEMIDDRFGFASNSIMNIYCGGFTAMEQIHKKRDQQDGVFCGETLVYELCNMYNIPHAKIGGLACHHLNHG